MAEALSSSSIESGLPRPAADVVPAVPRLSDVWALTKPGIVKSSMVVSAGSMALVADGNSWQQWVLTLVGIALSVAGAGALNMLLERDLDRRMTRTRERPLAARRVRPSFGFAFGMLLSVLSLGFMFQAGGWLALGLTLFAQFSYLLVYTPMKRVSWWALVVGAIPGALPILMGTAALTGTVEPVGLSLFAILCLWQLPHFIAISIYRSEEYTKAGYPVLPVQYGVFASKVAILVTTLLVVGASFTLVPLDVAGGVYGWFAALVGLFFVTRAAQGFAQDVKVNAWARQVFIASLIHQVVLFGALILDLGWQHF